MKKSVKTKTFLPPWEKKVFIIAEAGSNWRCGTAARDMEMAKALIRVAADAGADAVKFQTYRADKVYVPNAGQSDYLASAGIKQSISDIFRDLEMPYEMLGELAGYCQSQKIQFMSSPFSVEDAKAVDPFVSVHKIASYEISHIRLIEYIAATGKPLVLSTGAATEDEIKWTVDHFLCHGGKHLALMQCTAKYPAPLDALNVRAVSSLSEVFNVPSGLSDHSRDPIAGPAAAVALGARIIEKHFTLDNNLPGPDHAFAILPSELKEMVRVIRSVEKTLGDGRIYVLPEENELRDYARRGIQATRNIKKGESLSEGVNIDILRPGKQRIGLHPMKLPQIEGRKAKRNIPLGDGILEGDFK